MQDFSIEELSIRCGQETIKYLAKERRDDRFCFELFVRLFPEEAAESRAAWVAIWTQYFGMVQAWVRRAETNMRMKLRHSGGSEPDRFDREFLYDVATDSMCAFKERFKPRHLEGAKVRRGLESILGFWKLLTRHELADAIAKLMNWLPFEMTESDLKKPDAEEGEDDLGRLENEADPSASGEMSRADVEMLRQAVWKTIMPSFRDQADEVAGRGNFLLGIPPRETFESYPGLYKSIEDVNQRIKRLRDIIKGNPGLMDSIGRLPKRKK